MKGWSPADFFCRNYAEIMPKIGTISFLRSVSSETLLFCFIGNSDFEGTKNERTFAEHTLDDRIMNIINRP